MVILEERKVKKIQLNEVSMEFVCKLYRNLDDKDTVLVIYNGDEYFTNVSYDEICRYNEEKDLIYFVKYLCREKSISFGSGMYEDAESIFKKHSFLLHLMLEESYKDGKMSFCLILQVTLGSVIEIWSSFGINCGKKVFLHSW